MTSGYARPEAPGTAFAYNDFAIQLYQKTLFDKVFQQEPEAAANQMGRFGSLQLEDGLRFNVKNRRLSASVRDFARISWFWLNDREVARQASSGQAILQAVSKAASALRSSARQPAKDDDYLGIGTFGGGSDHFTKFGPGIYGFNWWFNQRSRLHAAAITWPDAPPDTCLSIGAGGNFSVMIPSLGVIMASSRGKWGQLAGGDPAAPMNQHLKLLASAFKRRR